MRYLATVCALAVVLAGSAQLSADESNPDGVTVKASSDPKFLKVVEVVVPKGTKVIANYSIEDGASSTIGPFDARTTAIMPTGVATMRRTVTGEKEHYQLWIERAVAGAAFELVVGKNVYDIAASTTLETALKARPAPPPIPWHTFKGPANKNWTEEGRRRALQASVRVIGPGSGGSGTIVIPPDDLAALLKPGEELVYTAGHVVPLYLKGAELSVDVFDYEGQRAVSYRRCPARLLASINTKQAGDVACLAMKPVAGVRYQRAPIADSLRWYARPVQLFRVGCPGGKDPRPQHAYPTHANRIGDAGNVAINIASEEGDSGGGLFDPDGVLVGICSATAKEAATMIIGVGLLEAGQPAERQVTTSVFTHPNAATTALYAADKQAVEDARWTELRLPVLSAKHGVSESAEEGMVNARGKLLAAIEALPPDARDDVRKKFDEALNAYEQALKQQPPKR